jgi:tRNA nucleotidyltransferase (CCA-adding enzyme)
METLLTRTRDLLDAICAAGGCPLIVGGAVRDALLGRAAEDIDIEVYSLAPEPLIALLGRFGRVEAVGKSFGVLKLWEAGGGAIDIALPRRESRAGPRGALPNLVEMTPREAAARRDFTWNALALTPEGELLDYYGGAADLRAGIIRHVSPAFADDPLRVLRAMRFAAQFDMQVAPETAALCRRLMPRAAELPIERIWGEWRSWAERGRRPAAGLRALAECGWLPLYPELQALDGCPQHQIYHPEGDVFVHTGLVCDAAAHIAEREALPAEERTILLFAALCHDLGKPATTVLNERGEYRSPGHAQAGVAPSIDLLRRIGAPQRLADQIIPLVREHMAHLMREVTPRAVRRLAVRLAPATIVQWERLLEADYSGRPPCPPGRPGAAIATMAGDVAIAEGPPQPLVQGRDLLAAGYAAGPHLGRLLRAAYAAQIDGAFDTTEAGVRWVQQTQP